MSTQELTESELKWISEVNRQARMLFGDQWPVGIVESCGWENWKPYYLAGYAPKDALMEDVACWDD